MLKYLRLFEINPKKKIGQVEAGPIFKKDDIEDRIHNFFIDHLENSSTEEKVKKFRFQNPDVAMLNYALNCFNSSELFEENTLRIANKMKDTIAASVKNPFLLIMFVSNDPYDKDNNEEILSILKMETSYTLQITNPKTIEVLDNVLPSSKTKLQKCAFVYKKQSNKFFEHKEKENEFESLHSKILDRQDQNIASYFMKGFMESIVIPDNKDISKLAVDSITQISESYLKEGTNKELIRNKIEIILSKGGKTSFGNLVNKIDSYLDHTKLVNDNLDNESFSELAFELAYKENRGVLKEFEAEATHIPKKFLQVNSEQYSSLKISIPEWLIENESVNIQEEAIENRYLISIDKEVGEIVDK